MGKPPFVSFQPRNRNFLAFLQLSDLDSIDGDLEQLLCAASETYSLSIEAMRRQIAGIQVFRDNRIPIPARKIWKLGDSIFHVQCDLRQSNIELDGLYDHLERDLGLKRKWLEKVITFRRYIPNVDIIPTSLSWGQCEKGTKRVAEELTKKYKSPGLQPPLI